MKNFFVENHQYSLLYYIKKKYPNFRKHTDGLTSDLDRKIPKIVRIFFNAFQDFQTFLKFFNIFYHDAADVAGAYISAEFFKKHFLMKFSANKKRNKRNNFYKLKFIFILD